MKFKHMQTFIPTIDFEMSRSFYEGMGFKVVYQDDALNLMKKDDVSFFIQRAYEKLWAENTMMQIYTDDLKKTYDSAMALKPSYPMIRVGDIHQMHYGLTFHLIDPAGVLIHFTDPSQKGE